MEDTVRWGYVRVSTREQNIDRQIHEMNELGIPATHIFVDKATGANFDRPEYQRMKIFVRRNDEVYFSSLDRLGRDFLGIREEWEDITRRIGADIIILDSNGLFDSRRFREQGSVGALMQSLFLDIFGYMAERQRIETKERQAAGLEAARRRGQKIGRPQKVITNEEMQVLILWGNGGITTKAAAEAMGCSPRSVWVYAKMKGIVRVKPTGKPKRAKGTAG